MAVAVAVRFIVMVVVVMIALWAAHVLRVLVYVLRPLVH
jgi:hypothetical protein